MPGSFIIEVATIALGAAASGAALNGAGWGLIVIGVGLAEAARHRSRQTTMTAAKVTA